MPHAGSPGKITIFAFIEAITIWREMPVVRARVSGFFAEPNGAEMLPEHERRFPFLRARQRIGISAFNPIVWCVEFFLDIRSGVKAADAGHETSSQFGRNAAFCKHDSMHTKSGRGHRIIIRRQTEGEWMLFKQVRLVHRFIPFRRYLQI